MTSVRSATPRGIFPPIRATTVSGIAPTRAPALAPAFPLDPALYYIRGWDFYQRQDYNKAISEYNEAIKLEPHNATYYFARGVAYLDTNDYDKAISDFNKQAQHLQWIRHNVSHLQTRPRKTVGSIFAYHWDFNPGDRLEARSLPEGSFSVPEGLIS